MTTLDVETLKAKLQERHAAFFAAVDELVGFVSSDAPSHLRRARERRTQGVLPLVGAPRLDGDLETTRGAVIEVNVPPGLQYHYLIAEPAKAVRVAVPILQRLLS
jgi:hypothetical protein